MFKYPAANFASLVLSSLTTKSPPTSFLYSFTTKVDLTEAGIFYNVILADIHKLAMHFYHVRAIILLLKGIATHFKASLTLWERK